MKTGIYLVDTNAVSDALNGNAAILEIIRQARKIHVPSIVLGELYYMAENSGRKEANYAQIKAFIDTRRVVLCNKGTAEFYAKVRHGLKVKGRPISENDIWIAAIALQHNLTLLTRDSDFNAVDGLTIVGW